MDITKLFFNARQRNAWQVFDLTQLATRFDPDGGGHANACGCRIQSLENGQRVERNVVHEDIDKNIREWLKMWANR